MRFLLVCTLGLLSVADCQWQGKGKKGPATDKKTSSKKASPKPSSKPSKAPTVAINPEKYTGKTRPPTQPKAKAKASLPSKTPSIAPTVAINPDKYTGKTRPPTQPKPKVMASSPSKTPSMAPTVAVDPKKYKASAKMGENTKCPAKLCSGKTISTSEIDILRGAFRAADAVSVAMGNPDWSVAEIKAMQGGLWPENKMGQCYNSWCPSEEDVQIALQDNEIDTVALAKKYSHVNIGRLGNRPKKSAKKVKANKKKAKKVEL